MRFVPQHILRTNPIVLTDEEISGILVERF
jgi:hypothetical protein